MGDKDETVKDQVLKAMATLADDATFEDVIELVCLLMDIDVGLKQIDAGQVISQDEIKARLAHWLQ